MTRNHRVWFTLHRYPNFSSIIYKVYFPVRKVSSRCTDVSQTFKLCKHPTETHVSTANPFFVHTEIIHKILQGEYKINCVPSRRLEYPHTHTQKDYSLFGRPQSTMSRQWADASQKHTHTHWLKRTIKLREFIYQQSVVVR